MREVTINSEFSLLGLSLGFELVLNSVEFFVLSYGVGVASL